MGYLCGSKHKACSVFMRQVDAPTDAQLGLFQPAVKARGISKSALRNDYEITWVFLVVLPGLLHCGGHFRLIHAG